MFICVDFELGTHF